MTVKERTRRFILVAFGWEVVMAPAAVVLLTVVRDS